MLTEEELKAAAEGLRGASAKINDADARMRAYDDRIADVEQKVARRGGGGAPAVVKSWGQRFVESAEYKSVEGPRDRQGRRYQAVVADSEIEHKNITSVAASGGSLVPVDRRIGDPSLLPWNAVTVRDLVAPGTTESNAISYPRQKTRTNAAAPVAEGALKPQSDTDFEEVTAPVRTLAHFFLATRQIMDDAPALAATIDAEARAGLADVEDNQMLFGDGTGQNLFGIVPQATPFASQWSMVAGTPLDVLIQAIAQVEGQNWKCDGIVLNPVDFLMIQALKDTAGRYLAAGPFGPAGTRLLWNTPTATTNRMPRGKFLVGPFRTQAQIFDRMGVEVVVSTEDSDNFRRNLVTIRAEERLAFTVKRPASFVTGTFVFS